MSISPVGYSTAAITFAGSGDNTVVAAVTGKSIRVYGLFLVAAGATNLTVKDGTTALSGAMPLAANGSAFFTPSYEFPWFRTTPGNAFVLNSSNAVQISGTVYYEATNV